MWGVTNIANTPFLPYMLGVLLFITVLFWAGKSSQRLRAPFIVVSIVVNLLYLYWRVAYTLPLGYGAASVIMGILLLLAELVGFWQSMIYRMLFIKPFHQQKSSAADWKQLPTVDVLISTYNESAAILRRTVTACLNMDYPEPLLRIALCDDGRRPEIQSLAEELHVVYITRNNNRDAKAGNVNNALQNMRGDFVMLLDADMVPKTDFLQKTIGYFVDEKVGFVQTPQMFFNPDPFQFNLRMNQRIPNEQDFFMMDIQAARSNYNAVLHVGTNAVFRRSALDSIGGVPTGTITEDMATGMLLQAKGYRSIFVREVLCTGLSVESFSDLIRQRERWCRGNIQVAKIWNPLTVKGLSLSQRLIYLDGLIYWFFGVQKVIYLLAPLMYLVFGLVVLNASAEQLVLFWLPSYFASFLSFRVLSNKSRSITWSHIYEVAMAPYLAAAALMEALFSRPIPFRVTPKGVNTGKTTFAIRTATPFLLLLALTITGWVLSAMRILGSFDTLNSTLINIVWSVYNAFAIIISILVCVERPRLRVAERITVNEPVELDTDSVKACRIVDISETGVKIECEPASGSVEQQKSVHLRSGSTGDVEGDVTWAQKKDGKVSLGIAFTNTNNVKYRKIMKVIADRNQGYHQNKQK